MLRAICLWISSALRVFSKQGMTGNQFHACANARRVWLPSLLLLMMSFMPIAQASPPTSYYADYPGLSFPQFFGSTPESAMNAGHSYWNGMAGRICKIRTPTGSCTHYSPMIGWNSYKCTFVEDMMSEVCPTTDGFGYVWPRCGNSGASWNGSEFVCPDSTPSPKGCDTGDCDSMAGGSPAQGAARADFGNSVRQEPVFGEGAAQSDTGVNTNLYYNSAGAMYQTGAGSSGRYWHHSYSSTVQHWVSNSADPAHVEYARVLRPGGAIYTYKLVNNVWTGDPDLPGRLTQTFFGWTFTLRDGTTENYNLPGKLISITTPRGLTTTVTYNAGGKVERATGPFGHFVAFGYDAILRPVTLTDSNNQATTLTYDNKGNLARLDYADGRSKVFYYENTSFPNHLTGTGITDSTGAITRIQTILYNSSGKVASIEQAGGMEKYSINYDFSTQSTITDAAGVKRVLSFKVVLGVMNVATAKNLSDNKTVTKTFDANNNVLLRKDEENRYTKYSYNTANQRTSMIEAYGTTSARTTTYQYLSPTLDLPTLIESPSVYGTSKKRVTISYSNNLPTVITQSGYTPTGAAVSRTISLGYNANGQVTSINGARTDLNDLTTLTYNECSTGGACGQLQRITNALGQVTNFNNYDAAGRLLEMTDANGLRTTYTYDPRGRVASVTQNPVGAASRTTSYTYDAAGNVLTASLPTGLVLTYTYSAALKLTSVADNLGNRVDYGYDLKGNRTSEQTYDTSGTLVKSIDSAYDVRNRVSQLNDGGSITKQVMDAVGNLTKVTDPNTVAANGTAATTNTFDALNRLTKTVDLLAGNTNYTYDVNDRLKTVQAANGATTQYQYDDLGNLTKEISPDRGTTTYTHDSAGNVLTVTDARGQTATQSYDALNRLVNVSYADASQNVTYSYDSGTGCTYGVGRLCRVVDAAGESRYGYDNLGNVLEVTRVEMGVSYVTRYTYDIANRMTGITYPNGRQVSYTRDAKGNLLTASMALGGAVTPLVTESIHRPDGQLTSRRYGNGLSETRAYSLQGKLREQYLGSADTRLYAYDANGNLTGEQSLPQVGAYSYDALNRLTLDSITSTPASSASYTYDANGNRKTENTGTYAYLASSNRLTNAAGSGISLDAAGNTTSDGARSYAYTAAGTLSQVVGTASYAYNAQRQRTRKVVGSTATVYHYDLAGNLLAETQANGSLIRDYVWADGMPVAQVEASGSIAYLHTDHLNTPRLATDNAQQPVWRWDGKAFGGSAASGTVTVNLRFPGQYYDAETGLHYNWNRYYDPKIGRYITSDPIGLDGGLNTYAYVENNPLTFTDPTGENPLAIGAAAIRICMRIPRCAALLGPLIARAKELCSRVECEVRFDKKGHPFPTPGGGKELCMHYQIDCHIKGVKGSGFSIHSRLPICWKPGEPFPPDRPPPTLP